ncbi:hypothetical protein ACTS94_04875 [Empedobacter falsenii]
MKQICIFLSVVFLLFACATKRKTKEVEQVKVESEKSIVNDSTVNLQLQKSSYDYLKNYSSNETLLQKLGLTYAGKSNEDKAKVSLKQTDNGVELDIQGAIAMALEKEQTKDENITKEELLKAFDSIYNIRLQQDLAQREQRLIDSFKSNIEKEKSDISIWIYVVIGSLLVVATTIYVGIKQIKK